MQFVPVLFRFDFVFVCFCSFVLLSRSSWLPTISNEAKVFFRAAAAAAASSTLQLEDRSPLQTLSFWNGGAHTRTLFIFIILIRN